VDELSASSIFGGAKASQEADNILILQEGKRSSPSDLSIRRKYIQVHLENTRQSQSYL
jgi:twinkle protein